MSKAQVSLLEERLATKQDLDLLRHDLKADFADVSYELKEDIAAVRSEMKEEIADATVRILL